MGGSPGEPTQSSGMGGVSRSGVGGTSSAPAQSLVQSLLRSFLATGSDLPASRVGSSLAWPSPSISRDSPKTHLLHSGSYSTARQNQPGRHPWRSPDPIPATVQPPRQPGPSLPGTQTLLRIHWFNQQIFTYLHTYCVPGTVPSAVGRRE